MSTMDQDIAWKKSVTADLMAKADSALFDLSKHLETTKNSPWHGGIYQMRVKLGSVERSEKNRWVHALGEEEEKRWRSLDEKPEIGLEVEVEAKEPTNNGQMSKPFCTSATFDGQAWELHLTEDGYELLRWRPYEEQRTVFLGTPTLEESTNARY